LIHSGRVDVETASDLKLLEVQAHGVTEKSTGAGTGDDTRSLPVVDGS